MRIRNSSTAVRIFFFDDGTRIRIEVGEVVEVPDELEKSGVFADDAEAGLIQIEKTEKKPVSRRGKKTAKA